MPPQPVRVGTGGARSKVQRRLARIQRKEMKMDVEDRVRKFETALKTYRYTVNKIKNLKNEQWRQVIREDARFRRLVRSLAADGTRLINMARALERELRDVRRTR